MREVFLDGELEKEFQENGYVRIPFIPNEEVEKIKAFFYDSLALSGGQITASETGMDNTPLITYDFSFIDKNPEYKSEIYDYLTRLLQPYVDRILDNYKPIIANFIRKKPGDGEVPLHQNWAFSDETKCTTVSVWCPLVDGTIENGTLQVVPGSHKRFGFNRGPMVPWELENIRNEIVSNYLVPLETKAGDCVILDDSIVHYSDVNRSGGLRLAIQLICIPAEMPSYHYNAVADTGGRKIDVLEVDKDFYIHFNPWKLPENVRKVKTIKNEVSLLTEREFAGRLYKRRFDEKQQQKSFIESIKSLFS